MAPKLTDKRKIKRHHLPYYLQVHNKVTGSVVGHIVNLSEKGLMLVSKNPFLVNAIFEMQIRLPAPINGKVVINFSALSHWCHKDITPGCYDAGFSFTSAPEEISELVSKITDYFTFHSPQ